MPTEVSNCVCDLGLLTNPGSSVRLDSGREMLLHHARFNYTYQPCGIIQYGVWASYPVYGSRLQGQGTHRSPQNSLQRRDSFYIVMGALLVGMLSKVWKFHLHTRPMPRPECDTRQFVAGFLRASIKRHIDPVSAYLPLVFCIVV